MLRQPGAPLFVLVFSLACVETDRDTARRTAGPAEEDTAGGDTAADDTAPDTAPDDTATSCDTGLLWYVDADGDGHGDPTRVTTCDDVLGASPLDDDCDDTRAEVYAGAPERATSGRDDDCDGLGGGGAFGEVAFWGAVANGEHSGTPLGFGTDVGLPGDLDGDGFADLVVVSPGYDDGSGTLGAAAGVFRGPLTASADKVYGYDADSILYAGQHDGLDTVSGAGDLDGDGATDLLLIGSGTGSETYVYLLRGPVPLGAVDLVSTAQVYVVPGADSLIRGIGAGDLDGDGLDDVVLGAFAAADGAGEVYVLRGPVIETTPEGAGTILRGDDGDGLGVVLEPLGDLDGDGVVDFGVASAPARESFLVLDLPAGTVHPADAGVTVTQDAGATRRHHAMLVNPVGDLNGDGHPDAGFSEQSGSALLVLFGPFGEEPSIDLETAWDAALVSDSDWVTEPDVSYSAPLGDWDGDGHEDLAVANADFVPEALREDAWCSDGSWNFCGYGAVFLVAGPVAGGVYELEVTADRIEPEWPGGGFGDVLAAGSDLDADGAPDLVVGQPDADSAYVLFGGGRY
ncbi:MAG: FG-GAP-like repeat-containing protein [Pseudomonadota bacterium]|nr:FG-GAP-like repeat-containing protein [Pseudomonadota bacterium]